MKNRTVGVRVARKLRSTEHAVDAAMVEAAGLIQVMLESRSQAGLAAEVGQPTLEVLIQSLSQMASVRGAVVDSHAALERVASTHGLIWRMDGPLETKGDTFIPTVIAA